MGKSDAENNEDAGKRIKVIIKSFIKNLGLITQLYSFHLDGRFFFDN